MSRFLIPISDYNRIYQVIHGVRGALEGSEKSCIFFASVGAYLLNTKFGIKASAVAGMFAFCANDTPELAYFGEEEDEHIVSSERGFHMWVQTETHIIDFMAPIFPEAFAERGLTIPRKMFQRTLSSESENLSALRAPGDFFTNPNPELTDTLVDRFLSTPSARDLIGVTDAWFGKRRQSQARSFQMADSTGERFDLTLPRTTVSSSW